MSETSPLGTAVDLPEGYVDETDYSFRSSDGRRSLTARSVAGIADPKDMELAAKAYQDQAVDFLGARPEKSASWQSGPHGAKMAVLTLAFPKCDQQAIASCERSAFLAFPDGTGAQISYSCPMSDESAESEFQKILASVKPRSQQGASPFPSGQAAGLIDLDVPANLKPPTTLRVASKDGKSHYTVKTLETMAVAGPAVPQEWSFGPVGRTTSGERYELAPSSLAVSGPSPQATGQDSSREVEVKGVRLQISPVGRVDDSNASRQGLESLENHWKSGSN